MRRTCRRWEFLADGMGAFSDFTAAAAASVAAAAVAVATEARSGGADDGRVATPAGTAYPTAAAATA